MSSNDYGAGRKQVIDSPEFAAAIEWLVAATRLAMFAKKPNFEELDDEDNDDDDEDDDDEDDGIESEKAIRRLGNNSIVFFVFFFVLILYGLSPLFPSTGRS
jgi:hypothetical protein